MRARWKRIDIYIFNLGVGYRDIWAFAPHFTMDENNIFSPNMVISYTGEKKALVTLIQNDIRTMV